MPEFLKHFIVANSAVLFALLLIAGAVGVGAMGRALLRFVRRETPARGPRPNGASDAIAPLTDALLATHRRLDRLEAMLSFDRQLRDGRSGIQRHGRTTLPLILLAMTAGGAAAQERSDLPIGGDDGEIRATTVAELSFEGLGHAPDALASVFRLPGGAWGVSSRVFDGLIQRFDSRGAPAGTLGRAGAGPGEFGGQVWGIRIGDAVAVVDPGNARISIFDENLELVHGRPLPGRVRFVGPARTDDALLVSGFMLDDGETYAVARLGSDPENDVFGGELETDDARVSFKVAAADSDRRVWTFANSGGGVNVLSADDLEVMERWRLPGEDFQRQAPRRPVRDEPPVPQTIGAGASHGLIWLLVAVADQEWSPAINPARDGAAAYWDTHIFAIDADRRAIVAQSRLDRLCLIVSGNEISCVDELGEKVSVLELALRTAAEP